MEKPFSSLVVMEVILMEDFLLFSTFDGGKFDGWRKKCSPSQQNSLPNKFSPLNFLSPTEQKFLHHFGLHQNFCRQMKKRCTGYMGINMVLRNNYRDNYCLLRDRKVLLLYRLLCTENM